MSAWDAITIGARREIGSHTFREDEIMAFARQYDPQPFHVDRAAAARSLYGGIIASGWHTAAIWMKLMIAARDSGNPPDAPAVSPGFEDMQWLKPVRPGMTLTYSSEVIEKVALRSRPDLGLVKTRNEARDEEGTVVFRFTAKVFVERGPGSGAE